ncbi:hypothetical protein EVA_08140 [gut metagenome]|uniref:Uncharacterized protein n=1 Tax=gut metagenome TaxID=749906 RepID=J9GTQ6_9ZZZZ
MIFTKRINRRRVFSTKPSHTLPSYRSIRGRFLRFYFHFNKAILTTVEFAERQVVLVHRGGGLP